MELRAPGIETNEACYLEIVPIKWRPAILRLHQGHLEAMKLPPPDAVFSVKVCDQYSVYCGGFVVAIDNFSFG